jgi:Mg-chelatase subunit ChlD
MHSRLHLLILVPLFAAIIAGLSGCDSPLGIDTPRKEYIDKVSEAVSVQLCDPVSVVLPVDTGVAGTHFSAVLVFDGSGSISPQLNQTMKNAGLAFLDSLDGHTDEAAVVFFNSVVTVFQRMTTNITSLRNAVNALPILGATSMWDGIFTALLELQARGSHERQALIIITETRDNSSSTGTPTKIIALAQSMGVPIYTISMAISIDEAKLAEIAMESGGQHYRLPRHEEVSGIYREIVHRLKTP